MKVSDDGRCLIIEGRPWPICGGSMRDVEIEVVAATDGDQPFTLIPSEGFEMGDRKSLAKVTVRQRMIAIAFENGWKIGVDWSSTAQCCAPENQAELDDPFQEEPECAEVVLFNPNDDRVTDSDGDPASFPHMNEVALGSLLHEVMALPTLARLTIDRDPTSDRGPDEMAYVLNVGIPQGLDLPNDLELPGSGGWHERT